MSIRLALIQMKVEPGQRELNVRRACQFIDQSADSGATVVLLPEAMTLGWTDESARTEAEAIPEGPSCTALREAARRRGIYVSAGLVERFGGDVFNSAVLIGPDGGLLLLHRKLNELELGHGLYQLGDRLGVAQTPIGRLGLMICADGFARGQVIARALGYMGADLILSPCSWAVPSDHDDERTPYGKIWLDNYGPVARDFRVWIAGASNVGWIRSGAWQGRKCIGCSLLVGPDGEPALRGPYGADAEVVLHREIHCERRPARGEGWRQYWEP